MKNYGNEQKGKVEFHQFIHRFNFGVSSIGRKGKVNVLPKQPKNLI